MSDLTFGRNLIMQEKLRDKHNAYVYIFNTIHALLNKKFSPKDELKALENIKNNLLPVATRTVIYQMNLEGDG